MFARVVIKKIFHDFCKIIQNSMKWHDILYSAIYCIAQILMSDELASFRSLMGKVLTDSLLDNLYLLYN